MRIASGVTDQYIYFVAVDSTDLKTRETGLTTFTVYRSRNGGVATAMTTPTINETDTTNMPGVYELLLDEDMTIDAGDETQEMVFHITQALMAPVTRTIELYRPKITAGNTLDVTATGAAGIDWGNVENPTTAVDLSATDIQLCDTVTTLTGHTAQTGDNYARLGAPAGASVSADIAAAKVDTAAILADTGTDGVVVAAASKTGYSLTATTGLGNQTANITGNLSGSVGSVTGAVGSVTGSVGSVTGHTNQTGDTYALANGAAGFVAIDTVVDAIKVITDALTSAGAANLALSAAGIIGGTVQAGTLSTTQATTDLTGYLASELIGRTIIFTGGTANGQASDITANAVAGGLLTFTAITTAPVASDTFVIV